MERLYKSDKYIVITLGLLIHILLLLAVFDVYFSSPLDSGMTPIRSTSTPVAERLVLFVADGLRAEAIFGDEKENRVPFLTRILKNNGSWGVVHTRVPTESRPGHVALLAGIFEDPSAILKGWKSNPVHFDSVINQSRNAWCWGSPDIVGIFNTDNLSKIEIHSYDANMEDFGKHNTELLDTWVFDKVTDFLTEKVAMCSTDCDKYSSGGNIFFLHLLGIDTAGHGYKPHSEEYKRNIEIVDKNVEKIYQLFESVFNDSKTVYIFTSDHGMTDWGSHGAGSAHETDVPLITWGAGIKTSKRRQDINQIDIAPLLASLVGINIPINSLGILPIGYLNSEDKRVGEMLLSNSLQLLELFNVKRKRTEVNAIVYLPYENVNDDFIFKKTIHLKHLLSVGDFTRLVSGCQDLMSFLIKGLEYYQGYYQYPILISVSIGFLLWILFLGIIVINAGETPKYSKNNRKRIFLFSITVIFILCLKSKFPLTYYLYFAFPVLMLFMVYSKINLHTQFIIISLITKKNMFNVIFYIIGLELLVYGFFNRVGFTVLMLLVSLWVLMSQTLLENTNRMEKSIWLGSCWILSIFPSLPVMKTSFNVIMYTFGCIGWALAFFQMYYKDIKLYEQLDNLRVQFRCFVIQFCCLSAAAVYVLMLEYEYIATDSVFKYLSWIIFLIPLVVIPFTAEFIVIRLFATFFGFAPFYLLVSSNYEVLFSLFYIFMLSVWLLMESKCFFHNHTYKLIYYSKFQSYTSRNSINADVFRRAFMFMIFIFLGFFGTGNIASLNSFDPMWTRAFLTVFSPFKMAGLILLKIMVPSIFTCCVFRAINAVRRENVLSIFCIILMFSDLIVLQFMYLITNIGSWLDIGTSLSHFIIMEVFVTILLLLYSIAYWLTTIKYYM